MTSLAVLTWFPLCRCHPAPGPKHSAALSSCLARQILEVEFHGHTLDTPALPIPHFFADLPCSAHAALSPWEGQNAVDAAVSAYNSISMLRQQLLPTHRVHGIFIGKDWTPNSGLSSYQPHTPQH